MSEAGPAVGIIMGSQSDWETMQHAAETLDRLGIAYETRIVSAHRTPERLYDYARTARARGLRVIIAGAGGAAHLPGMAAALTPLPVLGVPIESRVLKGRRQPAVDRADAGRNPGRDLCHRRGRRGQRSAVRGGDPRAFRRGRRAGCRRLAASTDGACGRPSGSGVMPERQCWPRGRRSAFWAAVSSGG